MFIFFAISFIIIVGGCAVYILKRLLAPARLRGWQRWGAVGALIFVVAATPVMILLRNAGIENPLVDAAAWFGYTGLGFMSFILTFTALRDLLLGAGILFKTFKGKYCKAVRANAPANPERRRFLLNSTNTAVLTGAGLFTGAGFAEAKQIPAVKYVRVPFRHLPAGLDGFRIVQITDIHVSPTIKRPFVEAVVAAVNTLSADIVALTGDLVDGSVPYLSEDVAPLADLCSASGNFFVTGNHEYYSGVGPWIKKIRELGFTVLLNEHQIVSRHGASLLVAGVTDYRGGRFDPAHRSDPAKAMAGAPHADLKLLLAHQPRSIFDAAKAGFDLQISGHTHGGQFFPWNYLVFLAQPYVKGLHRHENTQIYISGGTGYWGPPVRIGSPSEITLIELTAEPES